MLYDNLGIGDRTRIGSFAGYLPSAPYKERETFDFLQRHLNRTK
jgi:hypothetical protein